MRHSVVSIRGLDRNEDLAPHVRVRMLQSPPRDWRLPWRLAEVIRELSPTLIHARNWGAWPDTVAARWLLRGRIPLVYSFHGLSHPHQPLRRRMAQRLLARATDCIFTVSQPARQLLAQSVGLPDDRIAVIPNGVDIGEFRPAPRDWAQQRLVVGTVGNLTTVKNHRLLVEAFAKTVAEGLDAELRIGGEGPLYAELRRQAHHLGVAERVQLVGQVRNVPRFLRHLDLFVLPSLSEAHPNALLEAMACGLACVATEVGGVVEVLNDGRAGVTVQQNANQLAHVIARLLRDPDRRAHLGRAARDRVCACYGIDQMAAAYERLYRQYSLK